MTTRTRAGGDGLPTWTAADRSIVDQDVVVWYSFGSHYVVRLEDWPVMPVIPPSGGHCTG